MLKADIGFFEELEGVLANKRQPTRASAKDPAKLKESKGRKAAAPKSALNLLNLQANPNPCAGCPFESKPRVLVGGGSPETAKLLVITERITELDILNRSLAKNPRYLKFLPLLTEQGFTPQDIYWVALTRCSGQEDLTAVEHCAHYLQQDLSRENIRGSLILGLRPFQLLIDKNKKTIFKSRGAVFELLGKPCMVTFADID